MAAVRPTNAGRGGRQTIFEKLDSEGAIRFMASLDWESNCWATLLFQSPNRGEKTHRLMRMYLDSPDFAGCSAKHYKGYAAESVQSQIFLRDRSRDVPTFPAVARRGRFGPRRVGRGTTGHGLDGRAMQELSDVGLLFERSNINLPFVGPSSPLESSATRRRFADTADRRGQRPCRRRCRRRRSRIR